MHPILKTTLAVAAIAVGVVATLLLVGLYLAGAANMTPERLKSHYLQLKLIATGGVACAIIAVVLLVKNHPLAAALTGLAPAAFAILFVIIGLML